ncbi:hypothetical protein M8C21_018733, partial [Ambrosia artemisiifolia]
VVNEPNRRLFTLQKLYGNIPRGGRVSKRQFKSKTRHLKKLALSKQLLPRKKRNSGGAALMQ